MFFGLCNSPATFQNMMNDIFIMETNEGWILIYIDDILIFLKRKEELQKLTLRVLKKLQENDLFANLDKCTFETTEVDYLGMIISENQIKMDPAKLEEIKNWPSPTTVERRVCDKRRKCERLWSELYKHLKHPTTLSTIKFKGGRDNPL